VSPSSATVRIGHVQSFSATVTGASGAVTWSVSDIAGGDTVVGTVDSNGQLFAANGGALAAHRHDSRDERSLPDVERHRDGVGHRFEEVT
jgi:hypothetical protein